VKVSNCGSPGWEHLTAEEIVAWNLTRGEESRLAVLRERALNNLPPICMPRAEYEEFLHQADLLEEIVALWGNPANHAAGTAYRVRKEWRDLAVLLDALVDERP
jgi:hypothetical protein